MNYVLNAQNYYGLDSLLSFATKLILNQEVDITVLFQYLDKLIDMSV